MKIDFNKEPEDAPPPKYPTILKNNPSLLTFEDEKETGSRLYARLDTFIPNQKTEMKNIINPKNWTMVENPTESIFPALMAKFINISAAQELGKTSKKF